MNQPAIESLPTADQASSPRHRRLDQLSACRQNVDRMDPGLPEFDLSTDDWGKLKRKEIEARVASLAAMAKSEKALPDLAEILSHAFQFPHVFPCCEIDTHLFGAVWGQPGDLVIANQSTVGFFAATEAGLNPVPIDDARGGDAVFAGEVNLPLLELRLKRESVAMVYLELCNREGGGRPISLANLKLLRELLNRYRIPLVLKLNRLIDNIFFIKRFEVGQETRDPRDIGIEICRLADVGCADLTQNYGLPLGGFVAVHKKTWFQAIRGAASAQLLGEGEQRLCVQGLLDQDYITEAMIERHGLTRLIRKHLIVAGLPVVQHHGCDILLDISHFPGGNHSFAKASFLRSLYLETGIRGAVAQGPGMVAFSIPLGFSQERAEDLIPRLIGFLGFCNHLPVLAIQERGNPAEPPCYVPAGPQTPERVFPMSEGQKALWYLHEMAVPNNMCGTFFLPPHVDVPHLLLAFRLLQKHHPLLRATFALEDEAYWLKVWPELPVAMEYPEPEPLDEAALSRYVHEIAAMPLDPSQQTSRLFILNHQTKGRCLIHLVHHLINDGTSLEIIYRDWAHCYEWITSRSERSTLTPATVDFEDYVAWQREMLSAEEGREHLHYWRAQLEPLPPILPLATDFPRPRLPEMAGATIALHLDETLTKRLLAFAREQRVGMFVLGLAFWKILLARYTRQEDLVVGCLYAARPKAEFDSLVGFFVNVLPLRCRVPADSPLEDLLAALRTTTFAALEHGDYPYGLVADALDEPHLYQAGYAHQNWLTQTVERDPIMVRHGLDPAKMHASSFLATAQTDLAELVLELLELPTGLTAMLKYNTALYEPARMARMSRHWLALLQDGLAHPHKTVGALSLLDGAERQDILVSFNKTDRVLPTDYLNQRFEAVVARYPEAPALLDHLAPDAAMTYAELGDKVTALASRLQHLGVGPEVFVGVCMERSPELVLALLATMCAGGAYVPLDPALPSDRLTYMLEDARVTVVLAQRRFADLLYKGPTTLFLDRGGKVMRSLADWRQPPVPAVLAPEQAAYMIYTSGSTGKPKGTINRHSAIANRISWHQEAFRIGPGNRVLQKTPFSFDVSVWEFFWPLTEGATLVVAAPEVHKDSAALCRLIAAREVDTLHFVPSMLQVFLAEPKVGELSSIQQVICSGEALPRNLQNRFYECLPHARLHNLYGPTEAAVDVSWWPCDPADDNRFVPIGAPIANTKLYVVDPSFYLNPVGLPGELCIGGVQLARAYHGRPALTAEKFVPDPFAATPGQRLYRTGDLVSWMTDGNLNFQGRIDFQVKLRGLRIELGEIEAALDACPGVSASLVLARDDQRGELQLVAYVQADAALAADIRRQLGRSLPDYMMPAALVFLETFPTTPNGKVDRRRLPEPTRHLESRRVAPVGNHEKALALAWAETLALEPDEAGEWPFGVTDTFMDLGGHSLAATRLLAHIRSKLGLDVSLRQFFSDPTIAGMAAHFDDTQADNPYRLPIEAGPRQTVYPLSFAQQRLWFLDQLNPGDVTYIVSGAVQLEGAFLAAPFLKALTLLVARHAVLRTSFEARDRQPVQKVHERVTPRLRVIDLSSLTDHEQTRRVERLARELAARPLPLDRPPLLRLTVLTLSPKTRMLLVNIHHIVSDYWSMNIFFRELGTYYQQLCRDQPPQLPPLPIQYGDFAAWQHRDLVAETHADQMAWWRNRLAGAPGLINLPTDFPRPQQQRNHGALYRFSFPSPLARKVLALSRRLGVTPYTTLLAAFARLLHHYTGQNEILLGMPTANRERAEIQGLIGFFVNTLVNRVRFNHATETADFQDFTRNLGEAVLDAMSRQDVPFERLVDALQPERDLSHNPIFQVAFQVLEIPATLNLADLALRFHHIDHGIARFDLMLDVVHSNASFIGYFEYNTDLFTRQTMARLAGYYLGLLGHLLDNPDTPLAEVPIMGPLERRRVLREWNQTLSTFAYSRCIHAYFEAQARTRGATTALVHGSSRWSYAQLNGRANALAERLRRLGLGPDQPVGVCLPRTIQLPLALMAVLKAGATYIPLDPNYPADRKAYMLQDSGARVVLADSHTRDELPPDLTLVDPAAFDGTTAPDRPLEVDGANLAYVIYTSGSTGKPKGVAISHQNAGALFHWADHFFERDLLEGVLFSTSVCFDLSVFEVFGTLALGGKVIVVENLLHLPDSPARAEVTLVNTVPSAMTELLHLKGVPASVRCVNLAGEPFQASLIRRIYELGHVTHVYNLYGPSEDTTYSTAAAMPRDLQGAASIGRPILNTSAYVLDQRGRPTLPGTPGELVLGGSGITRGYWCRPGLTAEKYIPDDFGDLPGARLYRTGDLTRFLDDGSLAFLGRIDHQVKLRGFRIELGEIEAALAGDPHVEKTVVLVREDRRGNQKLVAYIQPTEHRDRETWTFELRERLSRNMPEYMVPAAFVFLENLPLTPNGKIDRKALPEPELGGGRDQAELGPTAALLASIWGNLLGVGAPAAEAHFFEMGGHSLLATRLVAGIRDAFAVDLPLQTIFNKPKLAELAVAIEVARKAQAGRTALPPLKAHAQTSRTPLSFAQRRLWFMEQLEPGTAHYNLPLALQWQGPLDAELLERVLLWIIACQASLRTRFISVEGEPYQEILEQPTTRLVVLDLTRLPQDLGARKLLEIRRMEAHAPFDPASAPPLRTTLVQTREADYLLLNMHHIISDGWSLQWLFKHLLGGYEALLHGRPLPTAPPISYRDYTLWQQAWPSSFLEEQLAYWRDKLADAPAMLELPLDRPRPPRKTYNGAHHTRELGPALAGSLNESAGRNSATPFMTLLAAYTAFLTRYCGQEDVCVGSPIAGRVKPALEQLMGFFVNTLVLRLQPGLNLDFASLIAQSRTTCMEAYDNQELSFEMLVEHLQPTRNPAVTPLFQTIFTLEKIEAGAIGTQVGTGGAQVTLAEQVYQVAKFDLALYAYHYPDRLLCRWEYNTDLFDKTTIQSMAESFETLFVGLTANPQEALGRHDLMGGEQRRTVLDTFNQTARPFPREDLVTVFESWVDRTPDSAALLWGDSEFSYARCDGRANSICHWLRAQGVRAGGRVGLSLPRGPEAVCAVLGILKAGAAYVPLDTQTPPQRRREILEDSRAVLDLNPQSEVFARDLWLAEQARPTGKRPPNQTAYIMYTSGSTGKPKGVCIPDRAVVRTVCNNHFWKLDPSTVIMLEANLAFDASTLEIWGALLNGLKLAILPDQGLVQLPDLLHKHGVTTLFLTTQLFHMMVDERLDALGNLRTMMTGGEALSAPHARRFLEAFPQTRLINGYGPTENTVFTCCSDIADLGIKPMGPPLGPPLANTTVYVVNPLLLPQPALVYGELVSGGDGLASGYLDRPSLTAEKFVPNPFSGEPGARLYRTGDLVRWGSWETPWLEFAGRIDRQVKLRGFRIELGEIEHALRTMEGVRQVLVIDRETPLGKQLVAYVVGQVEGPGLKTYAQERLPAYMVPAAIVCLDQFPVNSNGKIDQKRLPEPVFESPPAEDETPLSATAERLAELWCGLLNLNRVGNGANFFELGGHSLLATRLVAAVQKQWGLALPLRDIFETDHLGALAARIDGLLGTTGGTDRIERASGPPVLSHGQQRLWFIDCLEPGNPAYNMPVAFALQSRPSTAMLEGALNRIIARHETLRTRFPTVAGEAAVEVLEQRALRLPLIALDDLEPEIARAAFAELTREEAGRPFHLAEGPLLRVILFTLPLGETVLWVNQHHIISDGWSLTIFLRELLAFYDGLVGGGEPELEPLPISYTDYAAWQRRRQAQGELDKQSAWWQNQLKHPPILELPTDFTRPKNQDFAGSHLSFAIPQATAERLRLLARQHQATTFMTLLSAFFVLLARYSGQRDLLVGMPMANRNRNEVAGLIGFFVNTLVLRGNLEGTPSFFRLLNRVRTMCLDSFNHQDLPFDHLVEAVEPERDLSRNPIFQVMFQVLTEDGRLASEYLALEPHPSETAYVHFDLSMALVDRGQGAVEGQIAFAGALFEPRTIGRMSAHYLRLLEAICLEGETDVFRLPMLPEEERDELLFTLNQTEIAHEPAVIHHWFERMVAARPDAVALVHETERLSYAQLNARAETIAQALAGFGVFQQPVGVCLPRNSHLPAALLGILKAGAIYVPLDPAYPNDRKAYMLADSGARVVLASADTEGTLAGRATVVRPAELAPALRTAPPPPLSPRHLAYLIYTSGSTGKPKGVAITHDNVSALLHWSSHYFEDDEIAGVLAGTSICFDLSVFELFGTLARGGKIILVENLLHLGTCAAADEVTLINTVPSAMNELLNMNEVPPSVRTVNLAGEPFQAGLIRRIYALPHVTAVHNLYGPSEDTTYSTGTRLPEGLSGIASIGGPITHTRLYLLDPLGQLCPRGVPGEILLAGAGLTRGYWGRAALTAEKYVPNPFGDLAGERLYRTGDLGRYRGDGEVAFLGRIDHQVKLRGFRIELGEIEAALSELEGVARALVLVRAQRGDKRLVAYMERSGVAGLEPDACKTELGRRLPDYMIPSVFVFLEAFPLLPNGKINRKALPEPEASDARTVERETLSPTEELVAAVWMELLNQPQIHRDDHFFKLGGHSLLATRALARFRAIFEEQFPLRLIFENPVLKELAATIDATVGKTSYYSPIVALAVPPTQAPLSHAQERLWFLEQLHPGTGHYNLPQAIQLDGPLPAAVIHRAIAALCARHGVLRTRFTMNGEQPFQRVLPEQHLDLPVIDLSGLDQAEALMFALIDRENRHPFSLKAGPLLRTLLFRRAPHQHVLVINQHHIISDGVSLNVLLRELVLLYRAFLDGRTSPLPHTGVTYAQYADWQRQVLQGEVLDQQLSFWEQQLADRPALSTLPLDFLRPKEQTFGADQYVLALPSDLSQQMAKLGKQEGTTHFMTLLAAFGVTYYRFTGRTDLCVGTPIANRHQESLEQVMGFFVNTLVLRLQIDPLQSMQALLAHTRQTTLDAFAHGDLPFEQLVQHLDPERDPSITPLYQMMFTLMKGERDLGRAQHDLDLSWYSLPERQFSAKCDLVCSVSEEERGLFLYFTYNRDLFAEASIARFAEHYVLLLERLQAEPGKPLRDLVSSPEQEQRLLFLWNQTDTAYPNRCLHQIVTALAGQRPDAVALKNEHLSLSYAQLLARSERVAAHLQVLGTAPGDAVAVCMERAPETCILLLAIVMVDAVYVPLLPDLPPERAAFIIADTGAQILVCTPTHRGSVPKTEHVFLFDELGLDRRPSRRLAAPDQTAYIMYTSGSTGTPKGVLVTHRGIVRLVCATRHVRVTADDVVSHLSALSFDATTFEIWLALLNGATLAILPPGEIRPDLLVRHGVTISFFTTQLFNLMVDEHLPQLAHIRQILFGGEAADPRHVAQLLAAYPQTRLVNAYGPTENACMTTCADLHGFEQARAGSVPIGKPIANTRVHVVDRWLRPAPLGAFGELTTAGAGLAQGYVKRPALTAACFVPNPFAQEPGERLYRTGDLVRWLENGELAFVGRIDRQVKLRGFRIELGEVEAALHGVPGVAGALALVQTDPHDQRLIAYVVGHADLVQAEAVKAFLKTELPAYMVPAAIMVLPAFPLNSNGKIDHKQLPPPCFEDTVQKHFTPPLGEIETRLAEIWRDLLGCRRVGRSDNFFELGGHSLSATRLLVRIRDALGVQPTLAQVFAHPRLEAMAGLLEAKGAQKPATHTKPSGETEIGLAMCWRLLSGNQQIFRETRFQEIAGSDRDLTGMLQNAFQVDLEGLDPALNLAETAALIERRRAGDSASAPTQSAPAPAPPRLGPRPDGERAVPGLNQERLWFLARLEPDSIAYNMPLALRARGPLRRDLLQEALRIIIGRHHILSSRFRETEDNRLWVVCEPDTPPPYRYLDLGETPEPEREAAALAHLTAQARTPFDLESGPVWRVLLIKLSDNHHFLLINMHHIISDGWSMQVLMGELTTLYRGLYNGQPAGELLPPPALQFFDFAHWQRAVLQGEELEQRLLFWRRYLADMPRVLELPLDRPRPPVQTTHGADHAFTIHAPMAALRALCLEETCTSFMFGLAAWALCLSRYSGARDLGIGSPVGNRNDIRLENMIGFFVDTLVLRVDLRDVTSLRALLRRLRPQILNAFEHQDTPFEKIVERLQPERDLSRTPLFQVTFSMGRPPMAGEGERALPGVHMDLLDLAGTTAKYEIVLMLEEREDCFQAWVQYNTDLFDAATIARLMRHFGNLLCALAAFPDEEMTRLPMMDEAERQHLLRAAEGDAVHYEQALLHEQVAAMCRRQPEAVALRFNGQTKTYGAFDLAVGRLARELRERGVGPETLVGVCAYRGFAMVEALHAVLRAGGAYVPVDPDLPGERLAFMIEDAGIGLVLVSDATTDKIPLDRPRINLDRRSDDELGSAAPGYAEGPPNLNEANHLAYLIYTSGSTGRPKGAANSHGAIRNRIAWMQKAYELGPGHRVLQKTPYSFDVSVWEFFWPLQNGAELVIARPDGHKDPNYLADLIQETGVTMLHFVPSMLSVFLETTGAAACTSIKKVFCSGEALSTDHLGRFYQRLPHAQLHNLYGPTEAAVDVTYHACAPESSRVPIGRPIDNLAIYVLDTYLQPVPLGVPGQLFIGGVGLARGYHGRPALTAKTFIPSPFADTHDIEVSRLYASGDLVRYLAEDSGEVGPIEFLGRIDHQVKLRGLRIELGEIEARIVEQETVAEATVLVREDRPGDQQLVAYVVPDPKTMFARLLELCRDLPDRNGRFVMPNGLPAFFLNRGEAEFVYEEIFGHRAYLKHGITLYEGDTVFDAGANIGMFSMFAGAVCPRVRVFAFEPIPPIFETLRRNVALHDIDALLFQCGLAGETREVTFTFYPHNSIISGRFADVNREKEVVRGFIRGGDGADLSEEEVESLLEERLQSEDYPCRLRRLSDIISEHNVRRIDLLKIDVEKSEMEVIAGIDEAHWSLIRQVVIEVHDEDGQLEAVCRLLKERGFQVHAEKDTSLTETHLYNIYARKPALEPEGATPCTTVPESTFRDREETTAALQSALAANLPEYMVPAQFVYLSGLPLTSSGKVNRKALPRPVQEGGAAHVSPRTEMEASVAAVWEDLLGIKKPSIHDNFFKLGGHSLLTVRLMAALDRTVGVTLPLSTLFQAPTIAGLAQLLEGDTNARPFQHLVPLNQGKGPPLFLVHPVGGTLFAYTRAAELLNRPVYGFQSPYLQENPPVTPTIEILAELYLKELRVAQPEGPYQLGAWSMGGTVVFEMLKQLEALGLPVFPPLLIDCWAPVPQHQKDDLGEHDLMVMFLADLLGRPADLETESGFEGLSGDRLIKRAHAQIPTERTLDPAHFTQLFKAFGAHLSAVMAYRPKPSPGKAVLIRASESTALSPMPFLGWESLFAEVDGDHVIEGNHYSLFQEPGVRELVQLLEK